MKEKYGDLSKKSPKDAADIVGIVDRRNYLAHTIRDIELAVLRTQSKHYHIISYTAASSRNSKIVFFDYGCEIWLTSAYNEIEEGEIRLILAHELGHVVHNLDLLYNPEDIEAKKKSDEEEIYAWQFAFHLIDRKSAEHSNNIEHNKFIYKPGDLRKSISKILEKSNPTICDIILNSLPK